MLTSILKHDTEAVLSALGVKNFSENEKVEVLEQILDHFNSVIIDTIVGELSEEQIGDFTIALDDPDMEEKITAITAHVPGLMKKIEDAVEQEFFVIRSAKEKLGA